MTRLPEKNSKELIKYFEKNPKDLKDLINYLDRFTPEWRFESLKYFQDLKKLEKGGLSEV